MQKFLSEKFVQDSIVEYLFRKGWSRNLRTKTLKEHGVDIKVRNNKFGRYWLIECKGEAGDGAKAPLSRREANFRTALGQIITRMSTSGQRSYKYRYKYGVGFPLSFESLVVRRLPYDVCDKLNIYAFLVDTNGKVKLYDWRALRKFQNDSSK